MSNTFTKTNTYVEVPKIFWALWITLLYFHENKNHYRQLHLTNNSRILEYEGGACTIRLNVLPSLLKLANMKIMKFYYNDLIEILTATLNRLEPLAILRVSKNYKRLFMSH